MAYGDSDLELAYAIGKEVKPGFMTDVRERMFIGKFGGKQTVKLHKGDTFEVNRLDSNDPVTDEMRGVENPDKSTMTYEKLTGSIKRFGSYFEYADHVVKTHDDPILDMNKSAATQQAASSIETLSANVIRGSSQVFLADGATRGQVTAGIRTGLFKIATRYLEHSETVAITKMQKSSPNYGEISIPSCFVALFDPMLSEEMRTLAGFVSIETSAMPAINENQIGWLGRYALVASNYMKPWEGAGGAVNTANIAGNSVSGKAHVYPIVLFGEGAFDFNGMQGEDGADIIVHNPTVSDTDKYGQLGHIAWLTWFGGMVKQQKYICRLEVTAKTDSALGA